MDVNLAENSENALGEAEAPADVAFAAEPITGVDLPPAPPSGVRDIEAPPEVRTGPPKRLSPSSASTFQQCPKRWKMRYMDRLPDPPGQAALAGTFAHLVLEHLLQESTDQRTIENAKLLARKCWPEIETDKDYVALELDETEARHFRWISWKAIEGLWTLENPQEVVVEATEQLIDAEIEGVPFRGIVDRLDREPDGLVVSDYKSGKAPRPRYVEGRLAQVLLYAAAIANDLGERPRRARLLYLGQRTVEAEVTDEALKIVAADLKTTWSSMTTSCESGEFEANTGPLCGWCPFIAECAEGTAEVRSRLDRGMMRLDAPAVAVVAPLPTQQPA